MYSARCFAFVASSSREACAAALISSAFRFTTAIWFVIFWLALSCNFSSLACRTTWVPQSVVSIMWTTEWGLFIVVCKVTYLHLSHPCFCFPFLKFLPRLYSGFLLMISAKVIQQDTHSFGDIKNLHRTQKAIVDGEVLIQFWAFKRSLTSAKDHQHTRRLYWKNFSLQYSSVSHEKDAHQYEHYETVDAHWSTIIIPCCIFGPFRFLPSRGPRRKRATLCLPTIWRS